MTRGRPSIYSDELAETICHRIIEGESLRSICRDPNMPGTTTIMRWLKNKEDFRAQYAWACEARTDADATEIVEIADKATPEDVNVRRLQVDARKWTASKMLPKVYGDRQHIEHAGEIKGGVLMVPAPVDRESWERAAREQQAALDDGED